MRHTTSQSRDADQLWGEYRDNFARHLLAVGKYLQTEAMRTLTEERGYRGLRLNFEAYIALIGRDGVRLTEIAEVMRISKQACNQTANQIEAAGYIRRLPDPHDGRAKLLALTNRGQKLRSDGVEVVAGLQQCFVEIVGGAAIDDAIATLAQLTAKLNLVVVQDFDHRRGVHDAWLGGLLPRLNTYVLHRLHEMCLKRGHPELKLSFGEILALIGPQGGRIQHMAVILGVSKQAISATATELENLGYIRRDCDPADARQVVLQLTDRGGQLIADSVSCVRQLVAEFSELTGVRALGRLQTTLLALYRTLNLGSEATEFRRPPALEVLAQQLVGQLGIEDAHTLARLLMANTPLTLNVEGL